MASNNLSAWERMKEKTRAQQAERGIKQALSAAPKQIEAKEEAETFFSSVGQRENSVIGQMMTDSKMAYRAESRNDNSLWKQTEKDRVELDKYTEKLMKDLNDQLTKYRADNDTDKIVETQKRLTELQKQTDTKYKANPIAEKIQKDLQDQMRLQTSIGDYEGMAETYASDPLAKGRLGNILSGAGKQSAGATGSAFAVTTEDMLDGGRVNVRGESMDKLSFDKNKALQYTQSVRDKTMALTQSGAADIEQAKQGLGTLGRLAVDTAAGLTQLGLDIGIGAATGLGAMPVLAVRAFGGAADQAKMDGASVDQQVAYGLASAAVEVFAERLSSYNLILDKAHGKSPFSIDKFLDGVVAGIEDIATTPGGRAIMNRVGSILASGMGEGFEEAISGVAEPFLSSGIYGKEFNMDIKEIGYQVLIGALTGAVTGVSGKSTLDYRVSKADESHGQVIRDTDMTPRIVRNALHTDKNSEAYKMADAIRSRKAPATNEELGKLNRLTLNQLIKEAEAVEKAQSADLGQPVSTKTATVLDTGTSAYVALGMKTKRAEAKAKVVQKLINGEEVSLDGMKSLNLTDAKYREIFTQLTGVVFPEGMTNQDQLMNIAKTANTVSSVEQVDPGTPVSVQTEVQEPIAQDIPQVSDEAQPLSYEQFGEAYRRTEGADLSIDEPTMRSVYDSYLEHENQTVMESGAPVTRTQFRSNMRKTEAGAKMSDREIDRYFDSYRESQTEAPKDLRHKLSKDVQDVIAAFEKKLGIRIEVTESIRSEKTGQIAEGVSDPGIIRLALDARGDLSYDEAVMQVLRHEVTHQLKRAVSEDTYNAFAKYVREFDAEFYQTQYEKVSKTYAKQFKGSDEAKKQADIDDEVIARCAEKLFEDEAFIRMVVGKNRTLAEKIHDIFEKLLKKLNLTGEAKKQLQAKRDLWAAMLNEAEENAKKGIKQGTDEDGNTQYSISSLSDAMGVQASKDENGHITFTVNGTPVSRITTDHIRNESGIGLLIKTATDNGFISAEDAEKQFSAAAELMNTIIRTEDPEMIWAYAGATMFSALKSNADGQYGTTVDFTTVCRKTQDMVSAMSHAMVKRRKGLTKEEITELQAELLGEGSPVPCPVCYVFSRWAGVGSILDNMYRWQNTYEHYTDDQIEARIQELRKVVGEKKDLKALLREQDQTYFDLTMELERNTQKIKDLREAKKDKATKKDKARVAAINDQISKLQTRNKEIPPALKKIEDSVAPELAWLQDVRVDPAYMENGHVNPDVLFNMDAGDKFASQYPLAWGYRTSRGPSAGKAIVPYSDMVLGDLIGGLKNTAADGKTTFKGAKGELTKDQKDAVAKALARTRAQNLIGGQRFQSTSDFRYEYALDYIQAFWELQAIGSNVQTYTKIVEFAELIASVGGDVNLSVMPRDKGYEDGHLIYSNVTGVDVEGAIKVAQMFDNAQLILVGVNDEHIRLALEDSEKTGGIHIGFVIPYHASGASDTFISALVQNLGEVYSAKTYTDYSKVQTDSALEKTTPDMIRRGNLRDKLLKGKQTVKLPNGRQGSRDWTPTDEDIRFMQRDADKAVDITGRSFEELREVEKRALSGDAEAIREYKSWTSDVLWKLYQKMWNGGSENGVRLNSAQAKSIMPHEYWNKTVNRQQAYINGFLFRSYCYNLGLKPRFTGIKIDGEYIGDFTDSKGYWKTLIDRPMYANDGTYRDQQKINVTNFQQGMLTADYGETHWGEYKVAEPDLNRAQRAAENWMRNKNTATAVNGDGQYSFADEYVGTNPELAYLPWENQVDLALEGKLDGILRGRHDYESTDPDGKYLTSVLYVAKEPNALLQEVGLSDLPLILTDKHLRNIIGKRWDPTTGKVVNRHNHEIPVKLVKRLPELIRNPLAIFASDPNGTSKGGIVILTEEVDPKGNPVCVTITPDQPSFVYDGKQGPAHFVNMYGRENADDFIKAAVSGNSVLYVDKKWASSELSRNNPKLGAATQAAGLTSAYNTIVREKDPTVKPGERQFSLVEDQETLDFLNNQEWVKVYRAMWQDPKTEKLYPPMGTKQKDTKTGKLKRVDPIEWFTWYASDEKPELIKFEVPKEYVIGEPTKQGPRKGKRFMTESEIERNRDVLYGESSDSDIITLDSGKTLTYGELLFKFELKKADGGSDVPAAYNPYFHTSLSALNDQFSSAYKRPGLVVVEGYIPKSELTSRYQAKYAKDPVGETTWHEGPVAGQLKGDNARKVYLSRYFRAERIVEAPEAAQMIAKVLKDEDIKVPWNVVTPKLREALVAEGVGIDYSDIMAGKKTVSFNDVFPEQSQYSLTDEADSTGTHFLSKGQLEYFKDSKVRDKQGRLIRLYHGTDAFGFTVLDMSKSDDGRSFFMTDSPAVAKTYSGTYETRSVVGMDESEERIDPYKSPIEQVAEELVAVSEENLRLLSTQEQLNDWAWEHSAWARSEVEKYTKLFENFFKLDPTTMTGKNRAEVEEAQAIFRRYYDAFKLVEDADMNPLGLGVAAEEIFIVHENEIVDDGVDSRVFNNLYCKALIPHMNPYEISMDLRQASRALRIAQDGELVVIRNNDFVMGESEIRDALDVEYEVGGYGGEANYELYANLTNPLVVECDEALWRSIHIPEELVADNFHEVAGIMPDRRTAKTRNFTQYAQARGYDGVIFREIEDDGPADWSEETSTVVVAFNSNQVKDANNLNPTEDPDLRYSFADDEAYLSAVERGDMETAQRMVDEAAKAAGYPAKLYHGTNAFGFTRVDLDVKEADGFSFWAANREDVSGTYTQYGRVRGITDEISDDAIDELVEEAVEEMDDAIGDFRHHVDRIFSEWVFGQTDNSYLHDIVDDANPEPGYGDGVYDVLDEIVSNAYYDYLEDNDEQYEDFGDWSENSEEAKALYDTIAKIEAIKSKLFNFDRGDVRGGIYALYANTDNMFVVDAKGNLWNELRPDGLPKIERGVFKDVPYKTRDVAKWARENGYDGVIFKNIKDNGRFGRTPAGDVYAFFKPDTQVKSADPVTYDDNGNVIPLSKRFDSSNEDIRYSLADDLTPEKRKAFIETFDAEFGEGAAEQMFKAHDQMARAAARAEKRAEKAAESKTAAETLAKEKSERDLTAFLMYHNRKLREQQRKYADDKAKLQKAKAEAVKEAVETTKLVERAKADLRVQATEMHLGKKAAERERTLKERMVELKAEAADRLRVTKDTYRGKMKEMNKLQRNAAKHLLSDKKAAEKRKNEIQTAQGPIDTIRKNPRERVKVEKMKAAAEALRTLHRAWYRNFVNAAQGIDNFAKRQKGGFYASDLVTLLGGSGSAVERIFKSGLTDREGNRIGESLKDVLLCMDATGKKVDEAKQALLQDYILHLHNIDRMSFVAKAKALLDAFESNPENAWLVGLDGKDLAMLVAATDAEVADSIAAKLSDHGKVKRAEKGKSGWTEADRQLAQEYASLLHNFLEAKDKPVFADENGNPVTADTSREIVAKYEKDNAWLIDKANGIFEWWDLFMRNWAVGDSLSLAEYEIMHETYPHYAPTYRVGKAGPGGANSVNGTSASVSKATKAAKGSTLEIVPIEDSFANIVSKIVRLARVNELYMNIIDTAMLDEEGLFSDMAVFDWDWHVGEYAKALQVQNILDGETAEEIEAATKVGLTQEGKDYYISGWKDGRVYRAKVHKDLFTSIADTTGYSTSEVEKMFLKAGNALTGPMKTAITGANPAFSARNTLRDLPTAIINSTGPHFLKYWKQAGIEMFNNSENWQVFQALGGVSSGYYNNNKGFAHAMSLNPNAIQKVKGAFEWFGNNSEAITRFAEYLSTIDRLGDTYEARVKGIKNAAEVTVDFSRSGRVGRHFNVWIPYWNPAIQGTDKLLRSVFDAPDGSTLLKQAMKTGGRAAMNTALIEVILQVVLHAIDRDDEWEKLSDRDKAQYYCIPLVDEHKFLKIPKNREWGAILGTPVMLVLESIDGRPRTFETVVESYWETSLEPNFLPPAVLRPDFKDGGFSSDIIGVSWMAELGKNEDFAGRAIVPYSLEQGSRTEQYNDETSVLIRKVAQSINFSPMQLQYMLTDYFGDFGKTFAYLNSPSFKDNGDNIITAAWSEFFGSFEGDNRYSNQTVSSYYEAVEELDRVVQDKKNHGAEGEYLLSKEYKTQKGLEELYGKQITALNKEVRGLPDGPDKDALKEEIARLASEAMDYYNRSMTGEIAEPQLTAKYAALPSSVSNELIRLDSFAKDYAFEPTGDASSKYTDPEDKKREYVLTKDDEAKDVFRTIYFAQYGEVMTEAMNKSKYRKANDQKKVEMLEEARDTVLERTKDDFFDWLAANRRSTLKK